MGSRTGLGKNGRGKGETRALDQRGGGDFASVSLGVVP